jgi:hypothetical protein
MHCIFIHVGAVDSVYENTVHMLVLILWFVIMMHGEYNVKSVMDYNETQSHFKTGTIIYLFLSVRQCGNVY